MHPTQRDDIEVLRAELETLRAEVRASNRAVRSRWPNGTSRPRLAKRLTRVGIVALMLALPVMVNASHQFTDVPTSHTFHAAISNIYGARLTSGCTATKFCPDANVTRGQMAAFLNRSLGRAGSGKFLRDNDNWQSIVNEFYPVAEVILVPGGGGGGTSHIWVTGTVTLWTSEVGLCPCEVQAYLDGDSAFASDMWYGMIGADMAPTDPARSAPRSFATTNVTVSHLFTFGSGAGDVFSLMVKVIPSKAPGVGVDGYRGTIQAIYVPFGPRGAPAVYPTPPIDTPPEDPRP